MREREREIRNNYTKFKHGKLACRQLHATVMKHSQISVYLTVTLIEQIAADLDKKLKYNTLNLLLRNVGRC